MGNHDYFGATASRSSRMLRARGVGVLRNEGVVIERDGAKLWLAAIDDTWTRRDDIERAMRDRPAGATTVLLAHDPNRFDAAADAGANVVLSGHTHGGQIGVPFLYRVANLASFALPVQRRASTGAASPSSTCTPAWARRVRRCGSACRPKWRSSRSARPEARGTPGGLDSRHGPVSLHSPASTHSMRASGSSLR